MNTTVLTAATERNNVLRNAYNLLGLSMIPTALACWIGAGLDFSLTGTALYDALIYFVVEIALIFAINAKKDTGAGVALMLLFTFFMGLTLSFTIKAALGHSHGLQAITLAAGATGIIFIAAAAIAKSGRDFSSWGTFLFTGLIMLIITSIVGALFSLPFVGVLTAGVGAILFSAYLVYDINKVVIGGETNYVIATLNVYLDLANLFVDLLQLILAFSGDD